MHSLLTTALTTLLTISLTTALPAPAPVPAGGPQGPGPAYPVGTRLNFAQLNTTGLNYLSYALPSLHPPHQVPVFLNNTVIDPVELLTFTTTNNTDSVGNTAITTEVEGYGLTYVTGQLFLQAGANTTGFSVNQGFLRSNRAVDGFYYCQYPESTMNSTAAEGTFGAEDADHSHDGASNGACTEAGSLIVFPVDFHGD